MQWLEETENRCCAFDFGTKGLLQDAIRFDQYDRMVDSKGRPHGLIGVRPELSVTFIDNHDTGSSQRHWPFPRMKKLEGYAYILSHPGASGRCECVCCCTRASTALRVIQLSSSTRRGTAVRPHAAMVNVPGFACRNTDRLHGTL